MLLKWRQRVAHTLHKPFGKAMTGSVRPAAVRHTSGLQKHASTLARLGLDVNIHQKHDGTLPDACSWMLMSHVEHRHEHPRDRVYALMTTYTYQHRHTGAIMI